MFVLERYQRNLREREEAARFGDQHGEQMGWGPKGAQIALWPTREDDKYPSIRHCQAGARSELDAMQTHRKLCNIGRRVKNVIVTCYKNSALSQSKRRSPKEWRCAK
ncbi:hypothetical protein QE152_g24412 [Popillia japonica]|uniref:Uncharacterized protein n=1 Tax=Popillia japonica TaxID=7064 RepID=A0AAW1KEK8_POPJA